MQQNNITAPFYAPNLSTSLFQEYPSVFQDKTFGLFNRAVTQPFIDAFDLLGRTYEFGKRGVATGIGSLSDNPRLTRDIYGLITAGEFATGGSPFVSGLNMGSKASKIPRITSKDIAVTDNLPFYGSKDFPVETLLGKKIIPFPADLMDAGRFYTGIDGVPITPVPLQGGSKYPLMKMARDKNFAFANLDEKQARKTYDLGADYAVALAMNPQSAGKLPSHFSNKNMGRIVGYQTKSFIDRGLIKPEDVPKLDNLIRSKKTNKDSAKLGEFVGFNSPDLIKYLDNLDFLTRLKFSEALNTVEARKLGVPNLSRIGQATINPAEAGTNPMDALILLELEKGAKPVKVADVGGVPHLSYDYAV